MKTDFESCVQQFEILTVLRNPDNCQQLPPLLLETDERKLGPMIHAMNVHELDRPLN